LTARRLQQDGEAGCGEIHAQNLPVRAGAVDHLKVGLCAGTMPDVYTATVRDISGFAKSLAP
jgi:hypothetical protein